MAKKKLTVSKVNNSWSKRTFKTLITEPNVRC